MDYEVYLRDVEAPKSVSNSAVKRRGTDGIVVSLHVRVGRGQALPFVV